MAISLQQLTIYLYSAHRAVIFAIAQLSCYICCGRPKCKWWTYSRISKNSQKTRKLGYSSHHATLFYPRCEGCYWPSHKAEGLVLSGSYRVSILAQKLAVPPSPNGVTRLVPGDAFGSMAIKAISLVAHIGVLRSDTTYRPYGTHPASTLWLRDANRDASAGVLHLKRRAEHV